MTLKKTRRSNIIRVRVVTIVLYVASIFCLLSTLGSVIAEKFTFWPFPFVLVGDLAILASLIELFIIVGIVAYISYKSGKSNIWKQ